MKRKKFFLFFKQWGGIRGHIALRKQGCSIDKLRRLLAGPGPYRLAAVAAAVAAPRRQQQQQDSSRVSQCPTRRSRLGPATTIITTTNNALNASTTNRGRHHHHHHRHAARRRIALVQRQSSVSSDEDSPSSESSSSSQDTTTPNNSINPSTLNHDNVDTKDTNMQPKIDWKLALLYTLLVLQVLIVMIYVTSTPHVTDLNAPATREGVSFVDIEAPQQLYENKTRELRLITGETSLRDIRTFKLFHAYNRTQCWRAGVDERQMQRELQQGHDYVDDNEVEERKCACNQGWHGSDCGQPEVVWRAIMASKQNVKLSRRKLARRIVHTFYVHDHTTAIAEVIVEELYNVVDLFVICDFSLAEDNFRHKLAKGFLAKQQDKILYLNVAAKAKKPARVISKHVWETVRKLVKNIRDDDIYVTTDAEQILNSRALMFLKVYDGWPQPIGFRLRWSVFGFFWQHPQRTSITVGACTVGLMREAHRFNSLVLEKELTNEIVARETLGLVIGDLNHYGGWYCQFCQGPANILVALREMNKTRELVIDRSVDVPFIEDLIGTGMWFDEKTSLLRAHRSSESYYAPEAVTNRTWKYDWLVENFYAKLDYY